MIRLASFLSIACAVFLSAACEAIPAQVPEPPLMGDFPMRPAPRRGQMMRQLTLDEEAAALEFIRNLDSTRVNRILALKATRPRTYRAIILRSLNMQRHSRAMGGGRRGNGFGQNNELFRTMFDLREEMDRLALEYKMAPNDVDRSRIRDLFRAVASQMFDSQTQMHRAQIEQIREELQRLERRVEERGSNRERYLDRQVEMILLEGEELD